MTENKIILEENKNYYERFSLAVERIRMIHTELWDQSVTLADKHLNSYFIKTSYFALQLSEIYNLSKNVTREYGPVERAWILSSTR
mgnify:CR=1 FL=1